MIQSSARAWLILSPPQLQASVAPFSSASQNGDSTSFWQCLYSSYCYWLPSLCSPPRQPVAFRAQLLGLLAPAASASINRGLLCAVISACLVYPASLILAASLPQGCSYLGALAVSFLLLPHGSCLFKPSAASWISQIQGFVSWFLFL